MSFEVEVSSIPDLKIDQETYNKNLSQITNRVKAKLQSTAPRSKNAGPHMADMFQVGTAQKSGYETLLKITNTKMVQSRSGKQYSLFELISMGTSEHPIIGNPILHFINASGEEVFTHSVQHPGTQANKFVERAIESIDIELEEWSEVVYNSL